MNITLAWHNAPYRDWCICTFFTACVPKKGKVLKLHNYTSTDVPTDCVKFARYCGKTYTRHLVYIVD